MNAHCQLCVLAATLAIVAQPTTGQGYPVKPIHFKVSNAPGGAQHVLINPACDHMQQMEFIIDKLVPQL